MHMTASIDSEAATVTIKRGAWSHTFPVADLPEWIAYYKIQQGQLQFHAETYAEAVKALEALE